MMLSYQYWNSHWKKKSHETIKYFIIGTSIFVGRVFILKQMPCGTPAHLFSSPGTAPRRLTGSLLVGCVLWSACVPEINTAKFDNNTYQRLNGYQRYLFPNWKHTRVHWQSMALWTKISPNWWYHSLSWCHLHGIRLNWYIILQHCNF